MSLSLIFVVFASSLSSPITLLSCVFICKIAWFYNRSTKVRRWETHYWGWEICFAPEL